MRGYLEFYCWHSGFCSFGLSLARAHSISFSISLWPSHDLSSSGLLWHLLAPPLSLSLTLSHSLTHSFSLSSSSSSLFLLPPPTLSSSSPPPTIGLKTSLDKSTFLDVPSHLYKRLCVSVGPSIRPSVRPSIRRSIMPSLRRLPGASYAEYSALFSSRLCVDVIQIHLNP